MEGLGSQDSRSFSYSLDDSLFRTDGLVMENVVDMRSQGGILEM